MTSEAHEFETALKDAIHMKYTARSNTRQVTAKSPPTMSLRHVAAAI